MKKKGRIDNIGKTKDIKKITNRDKAQNKLSKSSRQELNPSKPKSYGTMRRVAKKKK